MNRFVELLASLFTAVVVTVLTFGPVWVVYHFQGRGGVLGVLAFALVIAGFGLATLFSMGLPFQTASALFWILIALSISALGVWIALRIAPPRSSVFIVGLPISLWVIVMMAFWSPAVMQLGRSIVRLWGRG